jgi:hypothetical protein
MTSTFDAFSLPTSQRYADGPSNLGLGPGISSVHVSVGHCQWDFVLKGENRDKRIVLALRLDQVDEEVTMPILHLKMLSG